MHFVFPVVTVLTTTTQEHLGITLRNANLTLLILMIFISMYCLLFSFINFKTPYEISYRLRLGRLGLLVATTDDWQWL